MNKLLEKDFLVDVMSSRQKLFFRFLIAVWILNMLSFCLWWFHPQHILSIFKFTITTLLLAWTLGLAGYFYFFVGRMKRVNPDLSLPPDWRVAMVVTKAPSEPFSMLQKTLTAMLNQKYPHHTWLADENPTPEVIQWCQENNIQISTRFCVEAYHQKSWPRRTKCKEGNLAYFYDMHGYEKYDIVVQLDADHIPQADYLEAMILPFVKEDVGYVSAPSICNLNENSSWATRGRLYSESIMHGPLQAGYSDGFAPLCIGSHYAVRTKALKEIGGLGPELAEDHSTTLMMNGNGWKGVHAYDAIAYGEGPETFLDCITQEFQWSRSLVILLLTTTPKYWKNLHFKLKAQFLLSQLWYPFYSLAMFIGFLIPIYAVCTKSPFVSVSYINFLLHYIPAVLSMIAIFWFLQKNDLLKPMNVPIFSWEVGLFNITRWPWTLYGCLMAVVAVITKEQTSFKVTPKGTDKPKSLNWKLLFPYIACSILSFIPVLFIRNASTASGYYLFLFLNVVIYIVIMLILILTQLHESNSKK